MATRRGHASWPRVVSALREWRRGQQGWMDVLLRERIAVRVHEIRGVKRCLQVCNHRQV